MDKRSCQLTRTWWSLIGLSGYEARNTELAAKLRALNSPFQHPDYSRSRLKYLL